MQIKSEHLWVYMSKCAHICNISLGLCMCACLSVCIFLYLPSAMQQAWGNSHLTSSAIPPSRQCEEETWLILGWSLSSHPASHFPFFLLPLSLCIPVICLCAWFSSLDWLTWESQWHHCPQAKTRLDEGRHTFLPLSLPRWVPPVCVCVCVVISLSTYHWRRWLGVYRGGLFI